MADETPRKRCRVENTTRRYSDITNELRQYAILDALGVNILSTVTMGYVFNKGSTALLLTNSGDVYGVVSRADDTRSDQQAAGDTCAVQQASEDRSPVLRRIEQLSNKNVVDFVSSDKQVLALTKEGLVYFCEVECCVEPRGKNNTNTNTDPEWSIITSLPDKRFIQAAFGRDKTFLLIQEGEILCWNGNISNDESHSLQISGIKQVVSGSDQTWVLSIAGILQKLNFFQQRSSLDQTASSVKRVECGDNHVVALNKTGVVLSQGQNNEGQLGTSNKDSYGSNALKSVGEPNIPVSVVNIAAYKNLSAAQTITGKVYVWGKCFDRVLPTPTETYITRLNNVFPILAKMVTTPKPIKSENKERYFSVKHSIAAMFDDAEDSDVTFKVGGKTIHAHKLLLKNRCEHFKVMLGSDWKECITGVIEIKNYTYEVYRAFLYYLYTDELDISYDDAVEMLDLAQSYEELCLKLRCEQVIEWWIRDDNAASIFQLSVKYECWSLQEACVRYGVSNMNGILLSAAYQEIEIQIARDFVVRIAKKEASMIT